MAVLKFTLSEDGVSVLRDALTCLGKFSDEVSLEAKRDRSAYASVAFVTNRFFSKYHYAGVAQNRDKFFCKLYNRVLLSLFRSRTGDPSHEREKDTTIDRCDVVITDEPGKKSRFVAQIVFRNGEFISKAHHYCAYYSPQKGITTKYRLPFEVSPPVHAKFDNAEATNSWAISSRTLRQLMDHFGPGIDYLDIHAEDETVNFTCFTEKAANGDVARDEFDKFDVEEENLHIVISVKDFRAIVQHASISGADVLANYSTPARPMQLRYDGDGIKCEFLLMTVGERGASGQKTKKTRANTKGLAKPQLEETVSRAGSHAPTPAPVLAPITPQSRVNPIPSLRPPIERPTQRPPPVTLESESLFVTQENDEQWEPVNVDEDGEEENARLGWDTSGNPNPSAMNMRTVMGNQPSAPQPSRNNESDLDLTQLEPTQRLSQARRFGLFGD
ncbi:hypothetical protein EKO27_g4439 [Xylaria grammica]|uniref:DNA repair protein rad9 n=1 Tax=Xylaria grammica TaxID=363999 RepID=A0A439D8D5_9PEZI|nr:hypothetical protein EKO27_g4439 [Xylaria grammica]